MKDVLAPIAGIPGVTGAAAFSFDDRCLASTLHPPYEEMLIERVMRTVRQALVTLNVSFDSEASWSGLFLRCDGGHLVVKRVGEQSLLVFGQPTMNVAMVNVGLNVAAMKLRNAESSASQAPGSGAPATGQTRIVQPTQGQRAGHDSQGSLTPTGNGVPSPIGTRSSQPIPIDTPGSGSIRSGAGPSLSWPHAADSTTIGVLTRTTIELMLRVLAKHVGPSAKTIMRDELVSLGLAPNAVPFSSYSDLVDQMARHIQDTQRRTAFLVEVELVGLHTPLR